MEKHDFPRPSRFLTDMDDRSEHELAERADPSAAADVLPSVRGAHVIAAQLGKLPSGAGVYRMENPSGAGVYRMENAKGETLYVGKAKSLRKRVAAYTKPGRLPERLRRMVSQTVSLEAISTHTAATSNSGASLASSALSVRLTAPADANGPKYSPLGDRTRSTRTRRRRP